jgi:hypothetical protein
MYAGRVGPVRYLGFGASHKARTKRRRRPDMSRMDYIEPEIAVAQTEEDADIALWNKMGRAAMFFCIWSAMAIPVLLVIAVR